MPDLSRIKPYDYGQSNGDIMVEHLERWVADVQAEDGLDMDPPYQRGHVWTDEQRTRYVEHIMRGGVSGRQLFFNHPNWIGARPRGCDLPSRLAIVDGKQRLTACLKFLRGEIPIFGHYRKDWTGHMRMQARLEIYINNFKTMADVIRWYIDLNAGGVVHTPEELARVRKLLEAEELKKR